MFMIFPSKEESSIITSTCCLSFCSRAACLFERCSLHRRFDESEEYVCIPAILLNLVISGVTVPKGTGEPFFIIFSRSSSKRDTFMPTATNSPGFTSSDFICHNLVSPAMKVSWYSLFIPLSTRHPGLFLLYHRIASGRHHELTLFIAIMRTSLSGFGSLTERFGKRFLKMRHLYFAACQYGFMQCVL